MFPVWDKLKSRLITASYILHKIIIMTNIASNGNKLRIYKTSNWQVVGLIYDTRHVVSRP